jgi:hypothetical protein
MVSGKGLWPQHVLNVDPVISTIPLQSGRSDQFSDAVCWGQCHHHWVFNLYTASTSSLHGCCELRGPNGNWTWALCSRCQLRRQSLSVKSVGSIPKLLWFDTWPARGQRPGAKPCWPWCTVLCMSFPKTVLGLATDNCKEVCSLPCLSRCLPVSLYCSFSALDLPVHHKDGHPQVPKFRASHLQDSITWNPTDQPGAGLPCTAGIQESPGWRLPPAQVSFHSGHCQVALAFFPLSNWQHLWKTPREYNTSLHKCPQ